MFLGLHCEGCEHRHGNRLQKTDDPNNYPSVGVMHSASHKTEIAKSMLRNVAKIKPFPAIPTLRFLNNRRRSRPWKKRDPQLIRLPLAG